MTDLETGRGSVKIGAMICYDREFPESARILMLKGAEILLVPNACPMEINRLTQLRTRAYENMLGIATVNYAAGQPDCNGHSSAFDGIAYAEDGSRDTLVVEAGESEGSIWPHSQSPRCAVIGKAKSTAMPTATPEVWVAYLGRPAGTVPPGRLSGLAPLSAVSRTSSAG